MRLEDGDRSPHHARAPRARWHATGAILGLVLASGCEGTSTGPCSVEYEDAVLEIRAVTDARTGLSFPGVSIFDMSIDGAAVPLGSVLLGVPTRNMGLVGATLLCFPACAFGSTEGRYTFTVARDGYRTEEVSVSARFLDVRGSCPARLAGPTVVTVTLEPE